ncbi:MAG TPA: 2-dehydropantoate 2-reductase [Burkholderiaceae bacterium]|nr:2-dehydropantoate 2-reductase [Burkholderiaceae bacterium]
MAPGPLLVMGAGSVGCYVGGRLQAAGVDVTYVGRPRVLDALRANGLTLEALDAPAVHLPARELRLTDGVPSGARPALVICSVKSGGTAAAAAALEQALPPGTPVLSLQNGVATVEALQRAAPALVPVAGMVPFNVAQIGAGRYRRATSGRLASADHPAMQAWQPVFERAGLPLDLHANMRPVQWAKLLLNLNNPVNALSGLPLREELLDRGYRKVLAALFEEALGVLAAARIEPAPLLPLPMAWLPRLLRLPTPLFRIAASRMLQIDPQARSSMADDLALGRSTEIDALCGEIVRLAAGVSRGAPLNERMSALVLAQSAHPRRWDSKQLRAAMARR